MTFQIWKETLLPLVVNASWSKVSNSHNIWKFWLHRWNEQKPGKFLQSRAGTHFNFKSSWFSKVNWSKFLQIMLLDIHQPVAKPLNSARVKYPRVMQVEHTSWIEIHCSLRECGVHCCCQLQNGPWFKITREHAEKALAVQLRQQEIVD